MGDGLTDALANISAIGPSINIRISARAPMDYVNRYKISPPKLEQQFVEPAFTSVHYQDLRSGYEVEQNASRTKPTASSRN